MAKYNWKARRARGKKIEFIFDGDRLLWNESIPQVIHTALGEYTVTWAPQIMTTSPVITLPDEPVFIGGNWPVNPTQYLATSIVDYPVDSNARIMEAS